MYLVKTPPSTYAQQMRRVILEAAVPCEVPCMLNVYLYFDYEAKRPVYEVQQRMLSFDLVTGKKVYATIDESDIPGLQRMGIKVTRR